MKANLDIRIMSTEKEARASAPEWTANGILVAKDGTAYCVQREQTNGAQAGGLIYYVWRLRPGEREWSAVSDTTRDRESRVRKIIERMVKAQNESYPQK